MSVPESNIVRMPEPGGSWAERDASGRGAMLTEILAQVSREALQGEGTQEVLQRIVDCLVRRLPVAIASIILLDRSGAHFTHEVYAGDLNLAQPIDLPWPVGVGAAGRCARAGQAQLIVDVEDDPDYVPGNDAVRSEYIVPIRHRQHLLGVLNIESTQVDFFTPETCSAFDAVADQIAGAIHLARVVGELEVANRKLRELSMIDGLTGIANRRCFDERLATNWALLAREGGLLALVMADADCFKELNDACGHLYGDECLRELARICSGFAVRECDLAARYGGEELILLLPGCALSDALRIGESLRARVEAAAMRHPDSRVRPVLTMSVGVSAVYPIPMLRPEALIAAADSALYAAKAAGRNRVAGCEVAGSPRLAS
ncbi:MAG TPA: sensor domain-containing diguanylate cyclase [Xanthomonadaceae bacterium]|jgi:diguanylate cyclase (GGDEF)-like protein